MRKYQALAGAVVWLMFFGVVSAMGPFVVRQVADLYSGVGYPERANMYRLTRPIGGDFATLTDDGVLVDTTSDPEHIAGYFAIIDDLDQAYGYTVTLTISQSTTAPADKWSPGLALVVTSHDPALDSLASLDLTLWGDAYTVNGDTYQRLDPEVAAAPVKTYELGIKRDKYYQEGSNVLVFYDYQVVVNGVRHSRGKLSDLSGAVNDFGVDPHAWPGWLWVGDDTAQGSARFELRGLRVDYNVPLWRVYSPILRK